MTRGRGRIHRETRVQRRRRGDEEPELENAAVEDEEHEGRVAQEQERDGEDARGRPRRRVGVARIATRARAELQELIGRPVTAVLGVERRDDGDWALELETLELPRVPETTSLMGIYEVVVAEDGEILEFRRTRRYHRGQADRGGEE